VSSDDETAMVMSDLGTATELVRSVARRARSMAPTLDAADLSTLGSILDELTSTLAYLTNQCAKHTERYPTGRILRDDTTQDPAARCAQAAEYLHQMSQHLLAANAVARQFQSTIGHIGVEEQP